MILILFGSLALVSAAEAPSLSVNIAISLKDPLVISAQNIDFGQVIPNQDKTGDIAIALAPEFLNTQRVKNLVYIIQKNIRPKNPLDSDYCNSVVNFPAGQIENNLNGGYFQKCYLPLCPFIEISKKSSDNGTENGVLIDSRPLNSQGSLKTFSDVFLENGIFNNDPSSLLPNNITKDIGVAAFNYPYTRRGKFEFPLAAGILTKDMSDIRDDWKIVLKTPCFAGNCDQNAPTESFDKIPQVLKDKQWGCDIVVSIFKIE